ncbi:MAG: alpha/beta hydrolase, partial [Chloroflexota bacterium]
IGPFPERTPLNARITRTTDYGAYRIEHIVYESIPGFYVTSSLYIPATGRKNSKLPAIIYCSGHSADGYRSDIYQYVILNLVKKGFIVFAFDPVGQGERLEYYDRKTRQSSLGGPTSEHSYPGAQAFLTGSSEAMYMIWDGIRAVDYLISRKEVDPARIGITGRSGGGTQSAYIAAFDDRIYAAAPENYITNYKRLLQTIGPQDAEQNLLNIVSKGLDHPDFLIVRAPKPALMITTSGDMFSIQGAMETEAEVAGIYNAYGKSENFSRCEDNAGHASTNRNREAMYAFFQKHLSNPGNPSDEAVHLLSADELRVTDSGQVSLSLNGETVFSLNMKRANELEKNLNSMRTNLQSFLPSVVRSAKELSGFSEPSLKNVPVFSGRIRRNGYAIEKYILEGEGNYVMPYLLFKPDTPNGKALIYLNPDGKAAGAKAGGEIESFVVQGYTVLAPDLIGIGETSHGDLKGDAYFSGASHNLWYASMLTGRSITGIRAGDVIRLVNLLSGTGYTDISGYAVANMAPGLLHAAVASDKIRAVILTGSFSSYMSIANHRFYNPFYILDCVPGALGKYDLPDLASALAPRKLVIEDAVDCLGTKTYSESIEKDLDIIRTAYSDLNAASSLRISEEKMSVNEVTEFLK